MIKLKLANDEQKLSIGTKHEVYLVQNGDEQLGFCEFEPSAPVGMIHRIECDDAALTDGVLRQTLFYMAQHGCLITELSHSLKEKLRLLYFIKPDQEEIKIAEFFSGSCH